MMSKLSDVQTVRAQRGTQVRTVCEEHPFPVFLEAGTPCPLRQVGESLPTTGQSTELQPLPLFPKGFWGPVRHLTLPFVPSVYRCLPWIFGLGGRSFLILSVFVSDVLFQLCSS